MHVEYVYRVVCAWLCVLVCMFYWLSLLFFALSVCRPSCSLERARDCGRARCVFRKNESLFLLLAAHAVFATDSRGVIVLRPRRFVTTVCSRDVNHCCALLCFALPQAVGASGAIFGMVGAWAAFCVMNESVLGRVNSQRALKNVGQTVIINVLYGMSSSQIDNMGHLGVSESDLG